MFLKVPSNKVKEKATENSNGKLMAKYFLATGLVTSLMAMVL